MRDLSKFAPGIPGVDPSKRPFRSDEHIDPVPIGDDIWYIGREGVGVFVIKTSEGLVMIDSMDPVDADEKFIVPDLLKLGLDPHDLQMIIITHGHFDHYAGAKALQDKYNCEVALGSTDCWFMVTCPYHCDYIQFPYIDRELKDREPLVFGEHRFIPVLTPGHTPGCMSLIFNCHIDGEEHWVSLWGGAGLPRGNVTPAESISSCTQYINSIHVFHELCKEYQCDVVLGVHPHRCRLLPRAAALKERKPGEPHPFIVGQSGVTENLKSFGLKAIEMAQNLIDSMEPGA